MTRGAPVPGPQSTGPEPRHWRIRPSRSTAGCSASVDAVRGLQVTLWGRELTACAPADVERFLLHADRCRVLDLSYGPRGNPGVNGLGLVVRVQDVPGAR